MSALVLNRYNGGIEIGKSPAAFDKIQIIAEEQESQFEDEDQYPVIEKSADIDQLEIKQKARSMIHIRESDRELQFTEEDDKQKSSMSSMLSKQSEQNVGSINGDEIYRENSNDPTTLLFQKIIGRLESDELGQSHDSLDSNDSFAQNYKKIHEANKEIKKRPRKENFNYLSIKTAEDVNFLIKKCQDSLDADFVQLVKMKSTFETLVRQKFQFTLNESPGPRNKESLKFFEQSGNISSDEDSESTIKSGDIQEMPGVKHRHTAYFMEKDPETMTGLNSARSPQLKTEECKGEEQDNFM